MTAWFINANRRAAPTEGSPRRQPWVHRSKREWSPATGERKEIMAHTFTNLLTHIVSSTKERVPVLNGGLKQRLFPYMGGILRELDATPLLINGPADHVHILAVLPPRSSTAEILNKLKSNSSGWVHKTFSGRWAFAWQTGYSAFAVSHSQKRKVLGYIAAQEEHHRKVSFQEELITLLKKHELKFDERYLLD